MISSNENSSENKKGLCWIPHFYPYFILRCGRIEFADDAYSFDDEEENVCLGHVDPKDKLDAEVSTNSFQL